MLRADYLVTNFTLWLVSLVGLYWGRSQIAVGCVTPIQGGALLFGLRLVYRGLYLKLASGAERRWRAVMADSIQTDRETPITGAFFSPNEQLTTANVVNYEINILMAFVMPVLFGGMGDFLSLLLPADWTTASSDVDGQLRLLQSRGGRSIIGGCIFVCAKDVVMLCCTWLSTQTDRKGKIFNFSE